MAVLQRRFQDWAWPRGGRVSVNVDVVLADDVVTRSDAVLTSPQLDGFALPVAACFAPPQL